MATRLKKPTCHKCKKEILDKYFLKCFCCAKVYDIDCTNVSEKRFQLMTKEKKTAWKCHSCHTANQRKTGNKASPVKASSSGALQRTSSTPSKEHITFRKPILNKQLLIKDSSDTEISTGNSSYESIESQDDEDDTMPNMCISNRSCPDLRSVGNEILSDHLDKIDSLEIRLLSAENEIQNLILENNGLKKLLDENEKTIKKLTHICTSTFSPKNPKIVKHRQSLNKTKLDLSNLQNINNNNDTSERFDRQHSLRANISTPLNQAESGIGNKKKPSGPSTTPQKMEKITEKSKICIISSNNRNKILQIAKNKLPKNTQICHYITPHQGLKTLAKGLSNKISNYSINDYCIIFIGEEDFLVTSNYLDLIFSLRETLLGVENTNIIICAPTYRYNETSNLFNWRIEIFNNLLHLDIETHKHAYLIDSNSNLSYDWNMFTRKEGILKNAGMKIIFDQIAETVKYIQHLNETTDDISTNTAHADINIEDNTTNNVENDMQLFLS